MSGQPATRISKHTVQCPSLAALKRPTEPSFDHAIRVVQEHLDMPQRGLGSVGRGALRLEVVDDGKGITPRQLGDRNAFGLLSMRERAHLWGGHVTIQGKPGQGTVVTLQMPDNPAIADGTPT